MGGIIGKGYDPENVDLRHFRMERVLGQGGFGKVHAATKRSQPDKNKLFAIKELSKLTIIEKKAHKEVFDELRMLSSLDYKLICNAHYAFQDERNLYLVMDLALGGDLRYRLNQLKKANPDADPIFAEPELRFDVYCVLLCLRHLHKQKILFRDMKPDNVLIQENGYILLTDFGISKYAGDGICVDRSGTHGYMAPECYQGNGEHTFNADMFSFGVMIYEMIKGTRPFTPETIKEAAGDPSSSDSKQVCSVPSNKIRRENIVSSDLCDLLERCVDFNKETRITSEEAIDHPFFKGFSEERFLKFEEKPLFLPDVTVANCDSTNLEVAEIFQDKSTLPKPPATEQSAFEGYVFNEEKDQRKPYRPVP